MNESGKVVLFSSRYVLKHICPFKLVEDIIIYFIFSDIFFGEFS